MADQLQTQLKEVGSKVENPPASEDALLKLLTTDNVDLRLKAVKLVGDLFALQGSTIPQAFHPVFLEFLKRLKDKVMEVQMSVLEHVKLCLLSDPFRAEAPQLVAALCDRLLDCDESIRKQVVAVVSDVASLELSSISADTIKLIAERLHDKSLLVKKYTMERLSDIYRTWCLKDIGGLNLDYDWIPGRILRCSDDKDFGPDTVEHILCTSLFPVELSVRDKVRNWVRLFSKFDKLEVNILEKILEQKQRSQLQLQKYLSLWQMYKDIDASLCIRSMSHCFVDPIKAEADLQLLEQLEDDNIWKILTTLLDLNTSSLQSRSFRDELLKIIGENHPLYELLNTLSMKCSYIIFDMDFVKDLLLETDLQKCAGNRLLTQSCINILVILARFSPLLLSGIEEDLVHLLEDDDEAIKEGVLHVLAKLKRKNLPNDLTNVSAYKRRRSSSAKGQKKLFLLKGGFKGVSAFNGIIQDDVDFGKPKKSIETGSNQKSGPLSVKKQKPKRVSGLAKCTLGKTESNTRDLIGKRIRIWWPEDKVFYGGVVKSYDHEKKKHVVLYDDEEIEVLNLAMQRWELIDDGRKPLKMHGHNGDSMEWTEDCEKYLLEILAERVKRDPNGAPIFKGIDWQEVDEQIFVKFALRYGSERVEAKYHRLRSIHTKFSELINHIGVTWDSTSGKVFANDSVWDELFKRDKLFKSFKKKGCKIYSLLSVVFSSSTTSGTFHKAVTCAPQTSKEERRIEDEYLDDGSVGKSGFDGSGLKGKRKAGGDLEGLPSTRRMKKGSGSLKYDALLDTWPESMLARKERDLAKAGQYKSKHGDITSSEEYSIGDCMTTLEATLGVCSRSYTKALSFFPDINWRKMFLMMSETRRKEWLDSLDE